MVEPSFGSRTMTLASVLRPWPSELMEMQDVSDLVNSPDNDSSECVEPLPPGYVQRANYRWYKAKAMTSQSSWNDCEAEAEGYRLVWICNHRKAAVSGMQF